MPFDNIVVLILALTSRRLEELLFPDFFATTNGFFIGFLAPNTPLPPPPEPCSVLSNMSYPVRAGSLIGIWIVFGLTEIF